MVDLVKVDFSRDKELEEYNETVKGYVVDHLEGLLELAKEGDIVHCVVLCESLSGEAKFSMSGVSQNLYRTHYILDNIIPESYAMEFLDID